MSIVVVFYFPDEFFFFYIDFIIDIIYFTMRSKYSLLKKYSNRTLPI